jgi:hypothetical protein
MADRERRSEVLPPAGLSWADYVARWVSDRGGWVPLADELIFRAGESSSIPGDPHTVERGLRRLARREHRPGGQYGRWMLRYFGFTTPVARWLAWMGQYHSRFADLPSALRLEQLVLWNRPPVSESRLACWIHIGLASVYERMLDDHGVEQWLARAERRASAAGSAAEIEVALFRGRLETDAGCRDAAAALYDRAEGLLDATDLEPGDALPYRARLADQRAYHLTKPIDGAPDHEGARALYTSIADEPYIPFVSFRRAAGLAYCAWKLGDAGEAERLARLAADHAGDGGLVRMRVMALNMLSRVLGPGRAHEVRARAARMAALLEDEELARRVAACRS